MDWGYRCPPNHPTTDWFASLTFFHVKDMHLHQTQEQQSWCIIYQTGLLPNFINKAPTTIHSVTTKKQEFREEQEIKITRCMLGASAQQAY